LPTSAQPTAPGSGSSAPTSTAPCTGEGCIPQPGAGTNPPGGSPSSGSGDSSGSNSDCSWWDPTTWGDCIDDAITSFFSGVVSDALNPLLKLLSNTLLTTPDLSSVPEVGTLWDTSWQLMIACYGMLILIAGIIVMAYETVQSRHSIKEIGPRLVAGFIAGSLSLWVATKGIELANGLAQSLIGNGLDPGTSGTTLANMMTNMLLVGGPPGGGIFLVLMLIALVGLLIVLLVTYIVRVAITILLIAAAPLFLMLHALPHTEGLAYWWWKAYGAVLSIQVGQSFVLIMALKILLAPGGFHVFGLTSSGLINVLVSLALMYILIKIPFWALGAIRGGGGGRRGLIRTAVRGLIAYKTMGLLGGAGSVLGVGRMGRPGGRRPRSAGTSTRSSASSTAAASSTVAASGTAAASGTPTTNASGRWWNWRARQARKWIAPQPGMLPMRVRRPAGNSTADPGVGSARHTLADELAEPRSMPWQQPAAASDPDLFSPTGQTRRHARPVPVKHPLIPPQPGMLPITLRHSAPRPSRTPLGDQIGAPRPRPGQPPHSAGLVNRAGRVNPAAKPVRVRHPLLPPEPGMLPLTVRHTDPIPQRHTVGHEQDNPPPATPPRPPKKQSGLLTPDGRVNRNATPNATPLDLPTRKKKSGGTP
jgi:hypothetical protein